MENYLARDDIQFHPHTDSSHRLVEIRRPQTGGTVETSSRSLSDSEIASIGKAQAKAQGELLFRLLLSPPAKTDVYLKHLPYSRDAYESLAIHWNVPACFPSIVAQHVPVGGIRVPGSSDGPTLILKSEVNWPYQFALCVSRTSSTTINCLCIGLHPAENSSLLPMLTEFAHLAPQHNLLVPVCLLSLTCHDLSKRVNSYQSGLWSVQEETGLFGRAANEEPTKFRPWNWSRLIRQLTGLSDSYARMLSRIATVKRMLGVVEQDMSSQEARGGDGWGELRAQMQWIKQTVDGSVHYVKWFQSSSADQMKTIAHFTQQHDNYLNLQLVRQSSRDGSSMSLIALVTLIFLPGTFAATMFSMSFFDFQPDKGAHVSGWFWLYWVVTAGMTVGVLGLFWWRVATVEAGEKMSVGMDTGKTKE